MKHDNGLRGVVRGHYKRWSRTDRAKHRVIMKAAWKRRRQRHHKTMEAV